MTNRFATWETIKPIEIRFSTEEVFGLGQMAVTVGSYHFTLQPKDSDQVEDEGRFMSLWLKHDEGHWRVLRDVTNSTLPTG